MEKKKYQRTIAQPMGADTVYKVMKQYVAWCVLCDNQIRGNGSIVYPYNCECRTYSYDVKSGEYREHKTKEHGT